MLPKKLSWQIVSVILYFTTNKNISTQSSARFNRPVSINFHQPCQAVTGHVWANMFACMYGKRSDFHPHHHEPVNHFIDLDEDKMFASCSRRAAGYHRWLTVTIIELLWHVQTLCRSGSTLGKTTDLINYISRETVSVRQVSTWKVSRGHFSDNPIGSSVQFSSVDRGGHYSVILGIHERLNQ